MKLARARFGRGRVANVAMVLASAMGTTSTARAEDATNRLETKGAFGEGMGVEATDGSFGMNLRARAQVRATSVVPDAEAVDPTADMQVRRMRVVLDAHGWKKLVTVRVQLAFATLDLDPVAPSALRDAFVTIAAARDLRLRIGQMKVPFGRQRVVSSGNLQMVDRSIVTGELNLDRDVGVQLFSEDLGGFGGLFGYNVGVFGGDGRNRVSNGYGLLYAARFSVRPVGGDRGDDLDEVLHDSLKPRLQFGVSGAFNHRTDRERSTIGRVLATGPQTSYLHAGADTTFKYRGLSIAAEAFLRRGVEDTATAVVDGATTTEAARSGYGGFVQAGQFLTERLELSGRVGALHRLGDATSGFTPERELGGGVSYYVRDHALKVQADTFYLWETWGEGRVQTRLQVQFAP